MSLGSSDFCAFGPSREIYWCGNVGTVGADNLDVGVVSTTPEFLKIAQKFCNSHLENDLREQPRISETLTLGKKSLSLGKDHFILMGKILAFL